jgi:hypothetical protein
MKVEASTGLILDIEASGDGDGDDIDAYGEVDEEFFSQNLRVGRLCIWRQRPRSVSRERRLCKVGQSLSRTIYRRYMH